MSEHVQNHLSGFYRLYDPKEFAKGKKVLLWGGLWKSDRKDPAMMGEFLKDYQTFSLQILEFLKQIRLFLIPIQGDRRIREHIEAGIASHFYEHPGVVGSFQNDDIRYKPRKPDEQSFLIKVNNSDLVMGLAEQVVI